MVSHSGEKPQNIEYLEIWKNNVSKYLPFYRFCKKQQENEKGVIETPSVFCSVAVAGIGSKDRALEKYETELKPPDKDFAKRMGCRDQ